MLEAAMASINARIVRFAGQGWHADLPWLEAELEALTPGKALNLNDMASFTTRVRAARVELDQAQLDKLVATFLAEHPGLMPLARPRVELLADNRLRIPGLVNKLPVSVRARIDATADPAVATPEAVHVGGVPVLWALKLLKIDPRRHLAVPEHLPVALERDGSARFDLRKLPRIQATLRKLEIREGRAAVELGEAPGAALPGNPHYARITTRGDVGAGEASLRNGRMVLLDETPETPLLLPAWEREAVARIQAGTVVVPEATLAAQVKPANGFKPARTRLQGTELVVEGNQDVLGTPVAVKATIKLERSAAGNLKLTPRQVVASGLPIGIGPVKAAMVDAMARTPGLRKVGDGVIPDLRALAHAELPPIRAVRSEPGKLLIET